MAGAFQFTGSLAIFVEDSKKKLNTQSAPKTVRRCGLTGKNGQTFGADRMATKIVRQSTYKTKGINIPKDALGFVGGFAGANNLANRSGHRRVFPKSICGLSPSGR